MHYAEVDPGKTRKTADEILDNKNPSIYSPNARQWTELKLPPGVNPDSMVCYASIDGQD